MKSHNLCTKLTPPQGFERLLGLGLNFCIQREHPTKNYKESFERLRKDLRTRYLFKDHIDNPDFNKKIYIPSPDWEPNLASKELENAIDNMENTLENKLSHHKYFATTNMTRVQHNMLKDLQENENFIVTPSDKNLGPCILEREIYIQRALKDHLMDETSYRQLQEDEAEFLFKSTQKDLIKIINTARALKQLNNNEYTYLMRGVKVNDRMSRFYIMPKIHKRTETNPNWKTRPVTSTCGSPLAIASIFLDFKLQPLVHFLPTYCKNWRSLMHELKQLDILPPNAKLFVADAVSMYTNIDTDHGLDIVRNWLNKLIQENKISRHEYPINFIMNLLTLVMKNNIFEFGDTYWLQLNGTAMGTAVACIYATLYFAWKETHDILPNFQKNLIFQRRYIDDVIGIWIDNDEDQWSKYKQELNDFKPGILQWEISDLSNQVDFLDLTIKINDDRSLSFQTFQKKYNLHLYVPSHSAHPPGSLKSLIFNTLATYWDQNSDPKDFRHFAYLLLNRLRSRGYDDDDLKLCFHQAAEHIDNLINKFGQAIKKKESSNNEKMVSKTFFHREYHPRDVPKTIIQQEYKSKVKEFLHNNNDNESHTKRLTIAFSRPKNLRDLLCPTTFRIGKHSVRNIASTLNSERKQSEQK